MFETSNLQTYAKNILNIFANHLPNIGWLALFVSFVGVWISLRNFRHQLKNSQYTEVDRLYFDVLKIALDKPYLANPKMIGEAKQLEYDIYAFIVWNFLETIYDKCRFDRELRETWSCIIVEEGLLHSEWFLRPENKGKFKAKFYNHICKEVLKPANLAGCEAE